MEFWYFIFEVKCYEEDTYKDINERGVICARNKIEVMEKLERWYGNGIYDIHIYDVNMDTEEILFEKNFPGLIDILGSPIEDY